MVGTPLKEQLEPSVNYVDLKGFHDLTKFSESARSVSGTGRMVLDVCLLYAIYMPFTNLNQIFFPI